jgi:valyl-tRNA synthetase
MAEIKVEKKKNYWGYIIGAILAVAVVVWFLMADTDGAVEGDNVYQENNTVEDNPNALSNENSEGYESGAISEYLSFTDKSRDIGIDHEYTNEAITKLIQATREVSSNTGVDINKELAAAMQKAEAITDDPMDTNHADKIKQAYLSITEVFANLQRSKFPEMSNDVESLRSAAEAIDPAVLTLDQKEKVKAYLDEAGAILEKMNSKA